MLLKLLFQVSALLGLSAAIEGESKDLGFTFNGFRSANLTLDGVAQIRPKGLLALTNGTRQQKGHAFYPNPITFKNSTNSSAFSFSTSFAFGIRPEYATLSGHGISFVIAPGPGLPGPSRASTWACLTSPITGTTRIM